MIFCHKGSRLLSGTKKLFVLFFLFVLLCAFVANISAFTSKKKGQYENTALFLIQYPMKTETKVQITFHATVIVLSN